MNCANKTVQFIIDKTCAPMFELLKSVCDSDRKNELYLGSAFWKIKGLQWIDWGY